MCNTIHMLAAKILELEGRLSAADRAQDPSQKAVVHPYRVGVQSETDCSSPSYLPT